MSDYYSHRDRAQPGHKPGYTDYAGGKPGGAWLWGGIVLVAVVALIGLGLSGGGTPSDGSATVAAPDEPAPPAAAEPSDAVPAAPAN